MDDHLLVAVACSTRWAESGQSRAGDAAFAISALPSALSVVSEWARVSGCAAVVRVVVDIGTCADRLVGVAEHSVA